MTPKTKLERRIEQVEKRHGRGQTYAASEAKLILEDVVPEWLLRGSKVLTGDMAKRCDDLVQMLKRAHTAVAPLIRDDFPIADGDPTQE